MADYLDEEYVAGLRPEIAGHDEAEMAMEELQQYLGELEPTAH
jgi:hypothetical protein